mgnify:CR=1 FL=1
MRSGAAAGGFALAGEQRAGQFVDSGPPSADRTANGVLATSASWVQLSNPYASIGWANDP